MASLIRLPDVVRALVRARIRCIVIGSHGMANWLGTTPGTGAFDLMVAGSRSEKAVTVLTAAFPTLESVKVPASFRLSHRDSGIALVNVLKPVEPPYFEVLKQTQTILIEHQKVRIPCFEMAINIKYFSWSSLYRSPSAAREDLCDLVRMANSPVEFDKSKVAELAERSRRGAGTRIKRLLRRIEAAGAALSVGSDPYPAWSWSV